MHKTDFFSEALEKTDDKILKGSRHSSVSTARHITSDNNIPRNNFDATCVIENARPHSGHSWLVIIEKITQI